MNGLTGTVANLYNALEPDLKITVKKGKYFEANDEFINKIKNVEGVKIISKTISDKVLIKNIDKQVLVSIKGVDANFNKITKIDSTLVEGIYALNDSVSDKILLGRGIANQLQVNMSSFVNNLTLYSPVKGKSSSLNPEDNFNQLSVTPCGLFSLNDEFDYQYIFVSIKTAKKLLNEPQKVSAIEIACEKEQSEAVQEKLADILGSDYHVKNRYQLNDVLFKALETEKLATFFILAFILIIATFNIIGALTMLIIEKRKDIKTLYSMGANISLIRNIFMREGFLITGLGIIIGLVLGLIICWLQIKFHLVKFGNEFIIPYYPIELQLKDFVWICGLIMIIGFFAALYPVRVFTKTDLMRSQNS